MDQDYLQYTLLEMAFNDQLLLRLPLLQAVVRIAAPFAFSRQSVPPLITMDYHRIEKGLSLRDPRPGFGKYHVGKLLKNIHFYLDRHEFDSTVAVAINALRVYREFNERFDCVDPRIDDKIKRLEQRINEKKSSVCDDRGGSLELTRCQIHQAGMMDLRTFFSSRHSVRNFSDEPVPRS